MAPSLVLWKTELPLGHKRDGIGTYVRTLPNVRLEFRRGLMDLVALSRDEG